MIGFKIVEGINCINRDHIGESIIAICVNMQCKTKNRFLCLRCLMGNNHCPHIQDCILFHFAHKFIDNAIQILQIILKISFTNQLQQENVIKQFFEKKKYKLEELKHQFDNPHEVKNKVEYIEFAFNILNFQKQFVQGCHQIIEKEYFLQKLESVFIQNINVYIEEAQVKSHNLMLNYFYEEAIQCCNVYLELQLDSKLLEIKGNCLHFLDCLDDALDIYSCAQDIFPDEGKFKTHQIMLNESANQLFYRPVHNDIPLFLTTAYQAQGLILQSNYREALQELNECKQEDSEVYIIMALKAECLVALNKIDEAKMLCDQIFKIYPRYYKAVYIYAGILVSENKHEELEEFVEKFKDKFQPLQKAYILSESYLMRKKFDEAEKILNEVPNGLKNDQTYQNYKIKLMVSKEQLFEAQKFVDTSYQPNHLDSILNEGLVKLASSKFDEALQHFEKGLQIDPHHVKLLKFKIYCLIRNSRYSEAIKDFKILKNLYPDSQEVKELSQFQIFHDTDLQNQYIEQDRKNFDQFYKKAQIFIANQQYNEALKNYIYILSIDPLQLKAQLSEIQCLILTKSIKAAIERAEYIFNYNKEAYFLKGFALYRLEKFQEALQLFEEIQKKDSNYSIIELHIANCLYKLKKYNQARILYQKLCEIETLIELKQFLKVSLFKSIYRLRFEDDNFRQYLQVEFQYLLNELCFEKVKYQKGTLNSLFIWSCIILQEFESPFPEVAYDWIINDKDLPDANIVKIIKALIFFNNNKLNESIEIYDEILKLDSKNLLALVGMAISYHKQGCQFMAEEFQKSALLINANAFNKEFQNDLIISQLEQEFESEEPHSLTGYAYDRDLVPKHTQPKF